MAVITAILMATSVLAGLPIAGADVSESVTDIEGQNPETVSIADQLQVAEGEVTVVARISRGSARQSTTRSMTMGQMKTDSRERQANLVRFADKTDGVDVVNRFWLGNLVLLTVDKSQTDLRGVASVQGVERLHPNYAVDVPEPTPGTGSADVAGNSADGISSDAAATYGLEQLNVPEVWQGYDTRGEGAKVAVLDTGVDADHPAIDLYTNDPNNSTYPGGWAEFDEDGNRVPGSEPHETGVHGTHTSGTVAGQEVSGVPAFGVAPDAKLMHGLVIPEGGGNFSQVIAGMQWAVEEDADVISMSLGLRLDATDLPMDSVLIDPVRDARAAGTIVVVSSGNEGNDTIMTPGSIYDATSIGAVDQDRNVPDFSSGGVIDPSDVWNDPPSDWASEYVYPDVTAPGVAVLSSYPDDQYAYFNGTSMAAPHVAGVAALLISASEQQVSPAEMDDVLARTAVKPDDAQSSKDTRYGEGIVDAYAAVSEVANASTSTVNVSVSPSQEEILGNETRPFDVVVEDVDGGVGSYAFTVSLSNATVASIRDVSLGGDPGVKEVNVSSDNSSVTVEAAVADTADTGDVTIGTVTLRGESPGSTDIELAVETVGDENGTTYTVLDASGSTLTVLQPATFTVATLEPSNYTAEHDEVVNVSATVENVGDVAGTQDVGLRLDDGATVETLETTSVDLDAGTSTTVEFDLDAGEIAAGTYTYSIGTTDDQVLGAVTVEAEPSAAYFSVKEVEPSSPEVVSGDRVTLSATIVNDGDLAGEQGIDLSINGESVNSSAVTLEGNASKNVTFVIGTETTDSLEPGSHAYAISTSNDTVEGTLTVLEQANLTTRSFVVKSTTVATGENVSIEATVANTGDVQGSTNVTLFVDGTERTTKTVEVAAGANRTVAFEVTFDVAGTHSVAVGDSAPKTVTVEGDGPVVLTNPATDPDGDGLYEDVNGDGEINLNDVQALYAHLDTDPIQDNVALFDFNEEGAVNLNDVQALYASQ